MRQKNAVRSVVKRDNKILLLRRAEGRESIIGKYELPGGSIEFGEQPDDALRRYVKDDAGVELETLQLQDAMGYQDPDDNSLQYMFIVFLATIAPDQSPVRVSQKYDKYVWAKLSELHQYDLTETTQVLLGRDVLLEQPSVLEAASTDEIKTTEKLIVYSDGGSRGNPGPSATGYVVLNTDNTVLEEGGEYLGITTNNQAEYQAVLLGLQRAKELGAHEVDFRVDSMLIVNQMSGVYKVKNRDLWPIHERIKDLIAQFSKVSFQHVRREFNTHADSMVNKILDEHTTSEQNPNRV